MNSISALGEIVYELLCKLEQAKVRSYLNLILHFVLVYVLLSYSIYFKNLINFEEVLIAKYITSGSEEGICLDKSRVLCYAQIYFTLSLSLVHVYYISPKELVRV